MKDQGKYNQVIGYKYTCKRLHPGFFSFFWVVRTLAVVELRPKKVMYTCDFQTDLTKLGLNVPFYGHITIAITIYCECVPCKSDMGQITLKSNALN